MTTTTEFKPTRDEFRKMAKYGNLIPVSIELVADAETPVSAFSKIDDGGCSFLLESAEHIDHGGRYSFLGSNPRVIFKSRGRRVTIIEQGIEREFETAGDPLAELQKLMACYIPVPLANLPRFSGGAVGYLGYDMVRFFEPTAGEPPEDDLHLPESLFMIAETLLIFDHQMRRLRVLANALVENGDADAAYDAAVRRIHCVLAQLDKPARLPLLNVHGQPPQVCPASNTTEAEFRRMVGQAHEFIHAGDIFQVVLSQRFETDYTGDPLTLYRCLRFVNPSPYLFCLKFGGEFALVGSSPEVHVRAMNGKVEIRPIAGTRRRGNSPEQDDANAKDLLADPKERAEHLMLVDLARNDVGRIANFGSVSVTDFMTIERYSHVMHIVSNVIGQLHPEKNAYDVMRATFPAGTVSGSPKVRAMQIINQLEKSKRGIVAQHVGPRAEPHLGREADEEALNTSSERARPLAPATS